MIFSGIKRTYGYGMKDMGVIKAYIINSLYVAEKQLKNIEARRITWLMNTRATSTSPSRVSNYNKLYNDRISVLVALRVNLQEAMKEIDKVIGMEIDFTKQKIINKFN